MIFHSLQIIRNDHSSSMITILMKKKSNFSNFYWICLNLLKYLELNLVLNLILNLVLPIDVVILFNLPVTWLSLYQDGFNNLLLPKTKCIFHILLYTIVSDDLSIETFRISKTIRRLFYSIEQKMHGFFKFYQQSWMVWNSNPSNWMVWNNLN